MILLHGFLVYMPLFALQIGHVTKSGDIAGPRVLEHIVDVVLYMEVGTLTHFFYRRVENVFPNISFALFLNSIFNADVDLFYKFTGREVLVSSFTSICEESFWVHR